jgi:hypothetical protein
MRKAREGSLARKDLAPARGGVAKAGPAMSTALSTGGSRRLFARRTTLACAALAALVAMLAWAGAARAESPEPWWHLEAAVAPTNLAPGEEGVIEVIATNVGDAPANGEAQPVTLSDKLPLPAEVKALEVTGEMSRHESYFGVHKLRKEEIEADKMTCPTEIAKIEEKQSKGEAISCTFNHPVSGFEALVMVIRVKVEAAKGTETTASNEASLQDAGAPPVPPDTTPLTIAGAKTPFGVRLFAMTPEAEGGATESQGGAHPFQLTNVLAFDETFETRLTKPGPNLAAQPRNLSFRLPPGLLGNPTAVPTCSEADFASVANLINLCPADTVVGAAVVHVEEPKSFHDRVLTVPVYNVEPAFGEPARFGFFVAHALVDIDTSVNPEEEYAATAKVTNASQAAAVLSSVVTLWGDPQNKVHDEARGWQCVEGGRLAEEEYSHELAKFVEEGHEPSEFPPFTHCKTLDEEKLTRSEKSFLDLPTRCGVPLHTTLEGVSWPTPEHPEGIPIPALEAPIGTISGCGGLAFDPKLEEPVAKLGGVRPDTQVGSTPTGMSVDVYVPQTGTTAVAPARSTSAVESTTLTLPEGVLLNSGAANGLLACTPAEIGIQNGFEEESKVTENKYFTAEVPTCITEQEEEKEGKVGKGKGAKVGTFTIKTPLLGHEIEGAVYLGTQDTGSQPGEEPFKPPLVLYLIIHDEKDGLNVKLAGSITPIPATGQITSTFKGTPQLPFEDLKLHFFGGGRASVTTPGRCETYTATSSFAPWSGGEAKAPTASFEVTSGPEGRPCGPTLPLAPTIQAGPAKPESGGTNQAGKFTNFSVTIARPDGDQAITGLNVTLPTGVAGVIANVTQCQEAQAELGTCGEESLIGHATTVSGLGSQPFTLKGGNVYLTVGYKGAPFGLAIVFRNIEAGPFHIGTVVVRSSILVNELTAAVTIATAVPKFVETVPGKELKGVPVQLKETNVETLGALPDGKNFEFNPTNCSPLNVLAEFGGDEGGKSIANSTLQFAGCEKLEFSPGFEAEVTGQGSKSGGVTFKVVTTSGGIGVANIARVHVALPRQLPSRLTTIQKACRDTEFNVSPASCPEGSMIGMAKIETPVLKSPLSGPAYLVAHGNAAFPDIEFVLQGEGIKLTLDGKTDIKKGITYSTFESTPDAPFTRFETTFPAGPHSALTANVPEAKNFNLCGEKLAIPTELTGQNGVLIQETTTVKVTGCKAGPTHAQLLAKALAACRKHHKKGKKRKSCEAAARHKYGAKKASHKAAHRATHRR